MNIGHLKIGNWPHDSIPLSTAHHILECQRKSCMITVNIQSKNSELQTTTTINKAIWHLFTSSETWKEVTKPADHNLLKRWPKIFIKKNPNFRKICYTSDRKKKHFPKPWWSSQLQKLRDKREQFYKIFKKTNYEQDLIQWKKAIAEFKSLAKKQEGRLWKNCQLSQQQYTYKSWLEQS